MRLTERKCGWPEKHNSPRLMLKKTKRKDQAPKFNTKSVISSSSQMTPVATVVNALCNHLEALFFTDAYPRETIR